LTFLWYLVWITLSLSLICQVLALAFAGEQRIVIYVFRIAPLLVALALYALMLMTNLQLRLFLLALVALVLICALTWVYVAFRASGSSNFWRWSAPQPRRA